MLKPDVDRLKELSERDPDSLQPDDFNRLDGSHMLKMAEKILPMIRTEKRNPNSGKIEFKDMPDTSVLPGIDEVSLLIFLTKNKVFN